MVFTLCGLLSISDTICCCSCKAILYHAQAIPMGSIKLATSIQLTNLCMVLKKSAAGKVNNRGVYFKIFR